MIEFFKKFLKPKEESVQFSDIEKWLESKNSEKENINSSLKEIESIKGEITTNLEVLEKVDVNDAKVEDKIKSMVKGNLPAYTQAVNIFLKKIVIPENKNHVNLEIFYKSFDDEFESLNKRTFRNFQIIKEIVGKELEVVAKNVKRLELKIKDVKKSSKKIKNISKMKEKARFIKDSFENKEKNKIRRKELEEEKEEKEKSCENLKKDIQKLENSEKAKELEKMKEEKGKISNDLSNLNNTLLTLFSPLQKAFKKYNNICFVKKVDSYVEFPMKTLMEDNELEILKFLSEIKKMIEDGKLGLKEEKKKKTLESIERLDENFLKEFIEKHATIEEQLNSVKEKIRSNNIMEEIEKLKKDLNVKSFKIENIKREIEKIKDVDIPSETNKLEKKMTKFFGYEIKIENVMG